MRRVSKEILYERVLAKLVEKRVDAEQARIVTEALVYADAVGMASHGTIRLEHYLNRIERGGINLSSAYSTTEGAWPWACLLDAAGGFGHVALDKACAQGIKMAQELGIANVAIKNSSHCGALSYYLRKITDAGYIAIIMGNTDKCVVPTGGKRAFLGTNPMAFGFPTGEDDEPMIIDMGTSEVALGKVLMAREEQESVPDNWGVDAEGRRTDNPDKVTALLPMAGHKGYCLALMIETFTAILTGSAFGPHVSKMYDDLDKTRDLAMFLLVIKPNVYLPAGAFEQNLSTMVNELHAQEPTEGVERVRIPGDREMTNWRESTVSGVQIMESVYQLLGFDGE